MVAGGASNFQPPHQLAKIPNGQLAKLGPMAREEKGEGAQATETSTLSSVAAFASSRVVIAASTRLPRKGREHAKWRQGEAEPGQGVGEMVVWQCKHCRAHLSATHQERVRRRHRQMPDLLVMLNRQAVVSQFEFSSVVFL
jgi:hypothetical protein